MTNTFKRAEALSLFYSLAFYFFFCASASVEALQESGVKIAVKGMTAVGTKNSKGFPQYVCDSESVFTVRVQAFVPENVKVQEVEIGDSDNFVQKGRSQSSSYSSINGNVTIVFSHDFSFLPARDGSFLLGPFQVTLSDDSVLVQDPIAVEVKEIAAEKKEVFASLELASKHVFVWQPVEATLKIQAPDGVLERIEFPDLIEIPGFELKFLGDKERTEVIDGNKYCVAERRLVLTPQELGMHEIPPISVYYRAGVNQGERVDPFINFFRQISYKDGYVKSKQVSLEVVSLPPTSLNVSGIGKFSDFSASFNKSDFQTGEPITLKLTLSVSGNFEQVSHPELNISKKVKYYVSGSKFFPKSGVKGGVGAEGSKVFEYIVQVTSAGSFVLPEQTFNFFNPGEGHYEQLKTLEKKLFFQGVDVDQQESLRNQKEAVSDSLKNDDKQESGHAAKAVDCVAGFDFNATGQQSPTSLTNNSISPKIFFLLLLIIFLFSAAGGYRRLYRKERLQEKSFSVVIEALNQAMKDKNNAAVFNIVKTFFSHLFKVDGNRVSEDWIRISLKNLGLTDCEIRSFFEAFNFFLASSFSCTGDQDGFEMIQQLKKSLKTIYTLKRMRDQE
jgi:hypothetical protein